MKQALALLGLLLVLNAAQALDLHFAELMGECGNEMGITPEQMKDWITKRDEQIGCVNACVLKKLQGLVDGKINMDNLVALLERNKDTIDNYPKIHDALKACFDEVAGEDMPECQLARKFASCMHDTFQS